MQDATVEAWIRRYMAGAADAAPNAYAGALAAATTGARIRDAAARAAVDAALVCRGGGVSWDEVYEALFTHRVPDSALSGAEVGFYYVATGNPWPPVGESTPMALWTCQSCLNRVSDVGPWDGPDGERGHAADCARHAADLAAWRLQPDDDADVEDEQ